MLQEIILQNRNHPSIILWGVRINESVDDDAFYTRTNGDCPSAGPKPRHLRRALSGKSHLLEDVYAYNDYSCRGRGAACEARAAVTSDPRKGYLISEFGGQQLPTKPL